MIAEVTFEKTTYADLPHKLKQGFNIAGGIAFGAALDYMNSMALRPLLPMSTSSSAMLQMP